MTQQTVGVFVNTELAYPGYSLFAPSASRITFLIDNCGRSIHQWSSDYTPGQSVYLMEDGSLLRTARINSVFQGGGSGGRVERITWDNVLTWHYEYSSASYHHHHDIEPLPNGNVLILAWEKKSSNEAIALGRNPSLLTMFGLWPDHIVEVTPIGSDSAVIVWEWHVWDHLIQDFDASKPGYGNISDHPELINLNFPQSNAIDWLHCNSIDYHPELDQILISVHNFNEIWIIDHSTTTEEAAGHAGGRSGRGGDLLYRWGNPLAYGRGTSGDQKFGGQHDAKWVSEGYPGEGQISVFNNNHPGSGSAYSSADFILPSVDSAGFYHLEPDSAFGPADLSWTFDGMPDDEFHSVRISGVQRLENGNTLICVGNEGRFFEVTLDGSLAWEYVSPVSGMNIVSQGSNPILNDVFRCERYSLDFKGFMGRDLMPGEPLELDPLPLLCSDTLSGFIAEAVVPGWQVFPNPVVSTLKVLNPASRSLSIDIFAAGHCLRRDWQIHEPEATVETSSWPTGLILLRCTDLVTKRSGIVKLLKL